MCNPPSHESKEQTTRTNVPEFSVSDLAFSLKRTLEENYGRVRVRGELSRVSIAASGHMYSSLKDDGAVIDSVCWKGTLNKLSIRPEEGLEVICTGRISSYPKSSKYQLIIESMELAGEGALLKMLEERKKKLAAEGLFAPEHKKKIPFLPQTIGVITSPTGAVIRDILHRLADRFPRHVMVWPVLVQGKGAADQITAAIEGFQTIGAHDRPRPDLLIVARGGGSLEDLMAFNEENVVRAAAACTIPLISAVGHETDTTLIDYASDLRAPTPTAAAEHAVPVRTELIAQLLDDERRLLSGMSRLVLEYSHQLEAQSKGLGDPSKLLEVKAQALDHSGDKLKAGFLRMLAEKKAISENCGARLRNPAQRLEMAQNTLERWEEGLIATAPKIKNELQKHLDHLAKMLEAYSFENVLTRGFAVIRSESGALISESKNLQTGQSVNIQFKQQDILKAIIGEKKGKSENKEKDRSKAQTIPPKKLQKKTSVKKSKIDKNQQSLF